jgi:hypothetical protein
MAGLRAYSEEEMAFLRQVPDLPDDLSMTPEQTSIVVGESLEWLRKKRQGSEGAGPPFEQHGAETSVRYPLGGVRRWKKDRTFATTREAREGRVYVRLSSFVCSGSLTDVETFMDGPDGRPVLCESSDPGSYPLTLDVFLERVRDAARDKSLRSDHGDMDAAAASGKPAQPKRGP